MRHLRRLAASLKIAELSTGRASRKPRFARIGLSAGKGYQDGFG